MRYCRNTVISPKGTGYAHYGRINKILPDNKYEVIDCGKHISIIDHGNIVVDGYKGCYEWGHGLESDRPRFRYMTTLRRLKQISQRYNPDVWKKPRHKLLKNDERISFDLARDAAWVVTEQGKRVTVTHFHGRKIKDHNHWYRAVLHDVMVTRYCAMNKALSVRGPNWHILVSRDYTERVEVKSGDIEDIKRDLLMVKLSG